MTEWDCPTCGRTFDTRRGLGVHHSTVHDERLPNRECEHCGERFYCDYDRVYCSEDCHDDAVSYVGDNNPNFRNAKEKTDCEICGSSFEYYPSDKEGLYCQDCVEGEAWRDPPAIFGSQNPRWKGGTLSLNCVICGTTVERYPNQVTGEVTVCGRKCHAKWLSKTFSGDGHPNWDGGGAGAYGAGWNAVRERALERDEYACVVCETGAEELGRNPDVHHLIPVRVFVESPAFLVADAHTLDNVVTLCPSCHRKAEFGHISRAELRWRAGMPTSIV